MTNKDIEIVFELLEKYHIYQLNSGKYWKKLTYHSSSYFDGYEWSLYLVFERDNICGFLMVMIIQIFSRI